MADRVVRDVVIEAQNEWTEPIDTGAEGKVHISVAGLLGPLFGTTIITVQAKPRKWPETHWLDIGTVVSGDVNGQSQLILAGSNVAVRAGVKPTQFSDAVMIYLAV